MITFYSLAAAYWKEVCPMADGVLGGCFCVTSLRAKYIAIIIAVPKRNATVYKEHLKHFFFQY